MQILFLPSRSREKEQGIDLYLRTTCTMRGRLCAHHSERGLRKPLGGRGGVLGRLDTRRRPNPDAWPEFLLSVPSRAAEHTEH